MTNAFFGSGKGGGGKFRQRPDTLRSNDVFEGVLALGVGPIEGLKDGLKSLKLNDTPVEDSSGNLNFKDMVVNLVDGDPALYPQPIKLNLGAAGVPTSVNITLTNAGTSHPSPPGDWVTRVLSNPGADFVDLRFVVNALYKQDKQGVHETLANIDIQLRPSGATNWINPNISVPTTPYTPGGIINAWGKTYVPKSYYDASGNPLPEQNSGQVAITGKTTQPYVKELRITLPNTGAYENKTWEIRCRLLEPANIDADPIFEKRTIIWESLNGGFSGDLGTTPGWRGVASIQFMGKATDEFNGTPRVEGVFKTKRVLCPASVYNPATRQYTGGFWNGSWQRAYTNDPAWVINDVISDALFGMSSLAAGSHLNKWDALEASKWCSELVPDGRGGTHPRYSMNFRSEAPQKAKEFIQYLAGAIGGFAWDNGNGEWRLKLDKPEAPSDIFTLDNIEGEFSYSHSDVSTRYNDITVTFLNEEADYKQDRVRIYDHDSIDIYGRKPTTIVGVGCTNRQEAVRRAAIRLRACQNETRTVTFTTNRRGRLLTPFSTILIADGDLGYLHPVGSGPTPDTDTTNNRTHGRVVAISANRQKITLRDTVRLEIGVSYTLHFAMPNPAYNPEATTQPADGTWDQPTITVTRNITNTAAQRGDVYDLDLSSALPTGVAEYLAVAIEATGLPTIPKMYRVLTVKPDDENPEKVAISAIEVDTGKWDFADSAEPGELFYEAPDPVVPPPLLPPDGEMLKITRVPGEGADIVLLSCSWQRPASRFLSGFKVQYRINNGPLIVGAESLQDTSFELQNPPEGIYTFEVLSKDRRGVFSQPLVGTITVDANTTGADAEEAYQMAEDALWLAQWAMDEIEGISSDSILSRSEKPRVISQYNTLIAERDDILDRADAYDIITEKLAYQLALTELTGYLATLTTPKAWNDLTGQTNIDGAEFWAYFQEVYVLRQELLNQIAEVAGLRAQWSEIFGPGKPEDGATRGAPAGTQVAGTDAETIALASSNFNASNDRNSSPIAAPTIFSDGTAIDHVISTDTAATISIEWAWSGTEGDIDGFQVFVFQQATNAAYTFGSQPEAIFTAPANKRAMVIPGLPADMYYFFAVRAYRRVDKDIHSSGVIASALTRPTLAAENPYRPSTEVAFAGNITGTINHVSAAELIANAANGAAAFAGTAMYRTPGAPSNRPQPVSIDSVVNANASVNYIVRWEAYTQGERPADQLLLFWRKDGNAPTVNDSCISFAPNTTGRSYHVFEGVNPAGTFSFGIAAARRTELGLEIGEIAAPLGGALKTNNLLQSNTYSNAAWQKINATVSENVAAAHTGTTSADSLRRTAVGHHSIFQEVAYNAQGQQQCFSVWLKRETLTGNVALRLQDGTGTTIAEKTVNPTTAWGRYYVSGTFPSGAANGVRVVIDPVNDTGVANDSLLLGDAMLEVGLEPTMNVTTTSAPANGAEPDWRGVTYGTPNFVGNINGIAAATVSSAALNYNTANDNNTTMVVAPTLPGGGLTIDHTLSTDGTVNISFEWLWGGNEADIDGFQVIAYQSTSSAAYTIGSNPANETIYTMPANARSLIVFGVPADQYYTFAVRAYRRVNKTLVPSGTLSSTTIKSTYSGENPYRPSTNVAFNGNVTGTVAGYGATSVATGSIAGGNAADVNGIIKAGRVTTPAVVNGALVAAGYAQLGGQTYITNETFDHPLGPNVSTSGSRIVVDFHYVWRLRVTNPTQGAEWTFNIYGLLTNSALTPLAVSDYSTESVMWSRPTTSGAFFTERRRSTLQWVFDGRPAGIHKAGARFVVSLGADVSLVLERYRYVKLNDLRATQ